MVTLKPHCPYPMGSPPERRKRGSGGRGWVKDEDGEQVEQEVREVKICWEESQGCIPMEPRDVLGRGTPTDLITDVAQAVPPRALGSEPEWGSLRLSGAVPRLEDCVFPARSRCLVRHSLPRGQGRVHLFMRKGLQGPVISVHWVIYVTNCLYRKGQKYWQRGPSCRIQKMQSLCPGGTGACTRSGARSVTPPVGFRVLARPQHMVGACVLGVE